MAIDNVYGNQVKDKRVVEVNDCINRFGIEEVVVPKATTKIFHPSPNVKDDRNLKILVYRDQVHHVAL